MNMAEPTMNREQLRAHLRLVVGGMDPNAPVTTPAGWLALLVEDDAPRPVPVAAGLSLAEVGAMVGKLGGGAPGPATVAAVKKWATRGVRGVKLATFEQGRTLYCTAEAVARFVDALRAKGAASMGKPARAELPADLDPADEMSAARAAAQRPRPKKRAELGAAA